MGNSKKKSQPATKSRKPSQKGAQLRTKIAKDVWSIVFFFLAIFTFLALISFNHLDPSVFSRTHRVAANIGGRVGANLSEALIQFGGLASFLVVWLFCTFGIRVYQGATPVQLVGNLVWQGVAFITAATLLSLEFGDMTYGGLRISCGGVLGQAISTVLRHYFNLWGATLLTLCFLLIALVFATPISAKTMYSGVMSLGRFVLAFMQNVSAHLLAFLKEGLAHHKEVRDQKLSAKETKSVPEIGAEKTPERRAAKAAAAAAIARFEAIELLDDTPKVPPSTDDEGQFELAIDEPITIAPPKKAPKAEKAPKPKANARQPQLQGEWKLPPLEFLKEAPPSNRELNRERLIENSRNLEQKLAEFGIRGNVTAVRPGPVVTMYEFKPGAGVKITQIASRADDVALTMEAQSVRIVAPIPGKSVVGIELPNDEREMVALRELLATDDFQGNSNAIPIVVGKDIAGAPIITDVAATPHLLIAGSSGAGKSVFINTLITSLLYKFTPHDLRLIMVDPKQLELNLYEKIPHLLLPVVDDPQKASTALRWACSEMERRYTLMARAGVRNLKGFNQKLADEGQDKMRALLCPKNEDGTPAEKNVANLLDHDEQGQPKVEHLPTILVIIDEFADLMMVAKKDIENHVARLAAKARASGIHLIIATQRPSTDVITGVIKNNLPSRIAFKVPSQIDSRTILDGVGAEKLLGKGDMLFIPPGMSRLVRVHGAYIDENEISKICDFWRSQGEPVYREEILIEPEALDGSDGDDSMDSLYHEAVRIVREEGQASASRLQRRLSIGYNRAARMIELMEEQGLVGPASGSKPREVIY